MSAAGAMLRGIVAALLLCLAAPAAAQDAPVRVAIETSAGRIVLALEAERAPLTTANFLRYVDQRRFDGASFYRAMRLGERGLIQGESIIGAPCPRSLTSRPAAPASAMSTARCRWRAARPARRRPTSSSSSATE